MTSLKEIAGKYIDYLQEGELKSIIGLFAENGMVTSPVYGTKDAKAFYTGLFEDTNQSELFVKGVFEDDSSRRVALYFEYKWTLKNGNLVVFDVVDILEFDNRNKINHLKIIYDTVKSRAEVSRLK